MTRVIIADEQMNTGDSNMTVPAVSSIINPTSLISSAGSATRLSFKDPDAFLPAEISEQLLSSLCERQALSDLTITLFDSKTTRLRCAKWRIFFTFYKLFFIVCHRI